VLITLVSVTVNDLCNRRIGAVDVLEKVHSKISFHSFDRQSPLPGIWIFGQKPNGDGIVKISLCGTCGAGSNLAVR